MKFIEGEKYLFRYKKNLVGHVAKFIGAINYQYNFIIISDFDNHEQYFQESWTCYEEDLLDMFFPIKKLNKCETLVYSL